MMLEVLAPFVSLALLALAFVPLERAFPAQRQHMFRREWLTDLAFFLGQSWLWSGAVVALFVALSASLQPLLAPFQQRVSTQPLWFKAATAVLLGDLLIYWGHRFSHRVDLLWRFHRVHHTAEQLDWLAAYREHPLDGLFTQLLINLPGIVMGFPIELIAGVAAFRSMWGVFIHSNVRLPLGPLKYVLGAPHLHRFHHERTRGGSYNFGNLMPLMDVLFGTYREPESTPSSLGISDEVPRDYLGQLLFPLVSRRIARKLAWAVPRPSRRMERGS